MRAPVFASRRTVRFAVLLLLMILLLLALAMPAESVRASQGTQGGPGTLAPLSFSPLPDVYQSGPRYEAQGPTAQFTFDRTGYTIRAAPGMLTATPDASAPEGQTGGVRMQFEDSLQAALVPGRPQTSLFNDFRVPDPRAWRVAAPAYRLLTYDHLYDGIDLRYEGLPSRFKGTFNVAPGADPAQIRWRFDGAVSVEISRQTGELWVELPGRPTTAAYLIEGAPLAWQELGERKVIVPASYAIDAEGVISYALGSYDPARPLVIDPIVSVTVSMNNR